MSGSDREFDWAATVRSPASTTNTEAKDQTSVKKKNPQYAWEGGSPRPRWKCAQINSASVDHSVPPAGTPGAGERMQKEWVLNALEAHDSGILSLGACWATLGPTDAGPSKLAPKAAEVASRWRWSRRGELCRAHVSTCLQMVTAPRLPDYILLHLFVALFFVILLSFRCHHWITIRCHLIWFKFGPFVSRITS